MSKTDTLVEALKAKWSEQPDKPEYEVGTDVPHKKSVYVAVDRVATPDEPYGLSTGQGMCRRRYLISFPRDTVIWLVAMLGAYLTDDEWRDAEAQRDDEILERSLEQEDAS